MRDIRRAGRALSVVTGSALALGTLTVSSAMADDLDGRHMSANKGAACAVRELTAVGGHVAATGTLPEVYQGVDPSGGTDGVRAACHAVRETPVAGSHP